MPWELVIFDCDGVLVDSEPISNRILAARLTAIGLPTSTEDSVRDFMGRSWASCEAIAEQRLGGPLPEGFADAYHAEVFEAFARELEPVAGVVEALERVDAPTCVASSGSHERIRRGLAATGLLERFDGRIFSATDVAHGKPAPDLFLHAAACMGADPAGCAVIEDSPAGVEAARAAGMAVFGYAGLTPAERLAGAHTFAAMTELPELLSGCAPRSAAAQ
jgi:HAD superfamily hydrolase (TIGR01509 family)